MSSGFENTLEENYYPSQKIATERKISKDLSLKQRLSSSPKRLRNFFSRLPQYQNKSTRKQNFSMPKKVKSPVGILKVADKSSQQCNVLHRKKNVKWKSGNELEDVTIFINDSKQVDDWCAAHRGRYYKSKDEKEMDELEGRFLLEGNLTSSEC